ncbi:MAG: hypothetical protein ACXABY_15910, partial [Candidatus Thorarchaeota archaeon]
DYATAASIDAEVDGTPGANDMPGRLVFNVSADGGQTLTERMRIAQDGDVTLSAPGNNTGSVLTTDDTQTLTNKTFDANGTGNSLSNVDIADLANGTDGELITWDAAGAPAAVAVGTATHVLTSNGVGAAPTFQAAAGGGGGNPYGATYVIAAAGGDYTSVGAWFADAPASGDILYIEDGTYTETAALNITTTNVTMIGQSKLGAIIKMNVVTTGSTWSGANLTIKNRTLQVANTGQLFLTSADQLVTGCMIIASDSAAASAFRVSATGANWNNNTLDRTAAENARFLRWAGTGSTFSNNVCTSTNGSDVTSQGVWDFAAGSVVSGCTFETTNMATSDGVCVSSAGTIQGCRIDANDTTNARGIYSTNLATVVGCYVRDVKLGIYCSNDSTITGNWIYALGTGSSGIRLGVDNVCTGNRFQGNASATAINELGDDNTITGNHFETWSVGINIDASADDNTTITGNGFNNVTTPITDSGTGTEISGNSGTRGMIDKHHTKMTNDSGLTINAGNVVVMGTATDGEGITTTTTAGDSKVLGMAVESIANAADGRIQTLGKTTLLTVDGTTDIAVGDLLTTFTTVGIAAKASSGQVAFAMALEAYTTDDSAGVIDAMIITPREAV